MATPRRRWFTVECKLYREPWARELKLSLVMLGMHMSDRWAADRLTAKQATTAHLALGDLLTITGTETRADALEILRQIASVVTLEITELQNGFVRVVWRKLAETQTWNARQRDSHKAIRESLLGPSASASASSSSSSLPSEEKKKRYMSPRKRKRLTPAPEMLSEEEFQRLVARLWHVRPHLVASGERAADHCGERSVREEVGACLDYFRGKGETRADWVATCSNWLQRGDKTAWERLRRRAPPPELYYTDDSTLPALLAGEKKGGPNGSVTAISRDRDAGEDDLWAEADAPRPARPAQPALRLTDRRA